MDYAGIAPRGFTMVGQNLVAGRGVESEIEFYRL